MANSVREKEKGYTVGWGKKEGTAVREISFDLIRGGCGERESRVIRGRVTRVCHGNMAPRRPRKFLIKFSPLPRARARRPRARVGTPSEFFHPCGSCEQQTDEPPPPRPAPFSPSLYSSPLPRAPLSFPGHRTWQLQIAFGPLEASCRRKVSFILIFCLRATRNN